MTNGHIHKSNIQQELDRVKSELSILYEISNSMRRSLKLDEVLYIILTGVTAHVGLGFNRAMLFLLDESSLYLEGKMGIGPVTREEADRIWNQIEARHMTLDELVSAYEASGKMIDSKFNRLVQSLKIPLKEEGGIIAVCALDDRILHIKESSKLYKDEPILKKLDADEFVTVPLRTKSRVIGVILADNIYTNRPIQKDDIRMLAMFANQAGLAIENSHLYEQTLIQTRMDSLTHLWNHGYFQLKLSEEIKQSKSKQQSLTLIMLDIDYFKNYNDKVGHQLGDDILVEIAKILNESSRKSDYVCRYGGEEFAIILPHTNKSESTILSERIRQNIQSQNFLKREIQPQARITVSIGLATYPEDAKEKDELIGCADKSLFEAKHTGKNRVCIYSSPKD